VLSSGNLAVEIDRLEGDGAVFLCLEQGLACGALLRFPFLLRITASGRDLLRVEAPIQSV
jgi:hypothetical protein